jgi:hypothetical protein
LDDERIQEALTALGSPDLAALRGRALRDGVGRVIERLASEHEGVQSA